MRQFFDVLLLGLAAVGALSSAVVANSFAQAASPVAPQSGVGLSKLSPPAYPTLARRTRITGDVNLLVGLRRDGSIESAVIVRGHPLLQQAALESAQQSQFECRGCTETVTPFSLVYTFQLVAPDCRAVANPSSSDAQQDRRPLALVSQSHDHVTVIDEGGFCDPGVRMKKVRSAKCLYLWKCGWHS
jgi:TonB family protein